MRTGTLVWSRAATSAYKVWLPVLLGLLTCALVAVAQSQYGAGVNPDSVHYYVHAHYIASRGLVPLGYSPLYPMLLALGRVVGLPLDWAATCVNALAFGLTVGVVALWVRKRGASLFLTAWAGLLCGTSVLAHLASFALTEPVCVALVTLSLFALDALLGGSRRKVLCLAVATGAVAAAGLARIAVAVPLVCVLVIFIFLCAGASSWWRRFGTAAVVGACALAPATAWFSFWLLAGPALAHAAFSMDGAWSRVVGEMQRWLLTPAGIGHLDDWIRKIAGPPDAVWLAFGLGLKTALLCVLGLFCGALAVMTRRYSHPAGARTFGLIVTFLAVYAGFVVVLLFAMDAPLDQRYLAPLYAPGVVAATLVVQGCVGKTRALFVDARAARRSRRAFVVLGWCGALGGLAACQGAKLHHQLVDTYDNMRLQLTQGRGYSAKRWRQSETMNFLRESLSAGAWVISEESQAVKYALNRLGARDRPRRYAVDPAPRGFSPEQIRAWFLQHSNPRGETYVVWFHDLRQPGHMHERDDRPRRLLSWIGTPGLRVLRAFKDGVVLRAAPPAERRDGDDRLTASSLKDAILAGVLAGARKLHSGRAFDLYQSNLYSGDRIGNQLIYSFRDCGRLPPGSPVFLHLVPVDAADLPAWRAPYGFDNLDHEFADGRRYIYPACLAIIDLPSYRVKSIRTGEYDGPLHHQSETMNFLRESVPAGALVISEEGQAVRYALNRLGSHDGPRGNAVVEPPRGTPEQIRAWFLQHSNPGGETYVVWFHDLRQPGYLFYEREDRPRRLLSYVGTPGLRVLRAFKDGVVLRAAPPAERRDGDDRLTASSLKDAILAGVLAGARKLHSGRAFDLYQSNLYSGDRIGNQLIYSFRDCGRLPPGSPVFLHLVPVDAADLPAWRARHGFDNLDHQFADGRRYIHPACLAIIDLPSYRVQSIRTGEYDGPLRSL